MQETHAGAAFSVFREYIKNSARRVNTIFDRMFPCHGHVPFRVLGKHNARVPIAFHGSDRHRRCRGGAVSWPHQYDARRIAEHFAAADADARLAAIRRRHCHHGDDLDHGALTPLNWITLRAFEE